MRPILLLAFDAAQGAQLAEMLGKETEVAAAGEEADALRRLNGGVVLCLGPEMGGGEAAAFLARAAKQNPAACFVILAAGRETELFQDFVDADSLFFLARRPPPLTEVAALLRSAARHEQRPMRLEELSDTGRRALALARGISGAIDRIAVGTDIERISGLAGDAAGALTDADEARFAVYDPLRETLWFRGLDTSEATGNSAASGVVGFVARTGQAVSVERLGDDPRYDAEADNGARSPHERLLAVPVLAPGSAFVDTLGVLVVTRERRSEPFGDGERRRLENFAAQIAPLVRHRVFEKPLEDALAQADDPVTSDGEPLYRREALHSYARGAGETGRPLELTPRRGARGGARSLDRKSTRLNPRHVASPRMPASA